MSLITNLKNCCSAIGWGVGLPREQRVTRGGVAYVLHFRQSESDFDTVGELFRQAAEAENPELPIDDELVFVNNRGQRLVNMGKSIMF